MQIRKTFVARELAGENYLVPIGEYAKTCSLIALSETAAFIWKALPDAGDSSDIVKKMLEIYEVDEETLRSDVEEFLDQLRSMEII